MSNRSKLDNIVMKSVSNKRPRKRAVGMSDRAFVKIYKDELPEELLYDHPQVMAMYIDLKSNAAFFDHKTRFKGVDINLKVMELVISYRDLAEKYKCSVYKIRKSLNLLKELGMIETRADEGFTRIKIKEKSYKNAQTASKSLLTSVPGQINDDCQTPIAKIQTAVNVTGMPEGRGNDNDSKTQYKNNIVNREKNNIGLKENNPDRKLFYQEVNEIIEHINSKFKSNGNLGIGLDSTFDLHRKKVKKLLQISPSKMALEMEISRYFNKDDVKNNSKINFGNLNDHLHEIYGSQNKVDAA